MFEGSDYVVEHYIKPKRIGKPLNNGERGDILGNFDDDDSKFQKKKPKTKIVIDSEENPFADNDESEPNEDGPKSESENEEDDAVNDNEMLDSASDEEQQESESVSEAEPEAESESESIPEKSVKDLPTKQPKPTKNKKPQKETAVDNGLPLKTDLTDNQVQALIRGASKKDRYVLYVTNLNYSTTRDALNDFFEVAGSVKSVRIPKVRKNAFAFVEMSDVTGFKVMKMHSYSIPSISIHVELFFSSHSSFYRMH